MLLHTCFLLSPCQLFHPCVLAEVYKGGEALEYLVGLDDHHNPLNGQLPPEGCSKGEGHNYEPCAYKIHFHGKLSVAAALENAEAHRHLIAHSHHNKAHNGYEIGGHFYGLVI